MSEIDTNEIKIKSISEKWMLSPSPLLSPDQVRHLPPHTLEIIRQSSVWNWTADPCKYAIEKCTDNENPNKISF